MALVYEHKKGQILHSPVFLQSGRILQRPFKSFFEKQWDSKFSRNWFIQCTGKKLASIASKIKN
jgi:hypothetical protein